MASEVIGKNVRSFIIKSIQCIVEARLGGLPVSTNGRPNGNDWFNIALNEFQDVNLMTKKCLEVLISGVENVPINHFLIKNDWNICCEISIKTNDNEQMNLEYWFIRSRTLGKELILNKNLDRETSTRLFKSYNEMSILIKSIISLTRATPAYRISRDGQSADSYIVCYRVYNCEPTFEQEIKKTNLSDHEIRCYSDEYKLGSVTTDHNIIDVSLVYRANLRSYGKNRSSHLTNTVQNIKHLDESNHSFNNLENPLSPPDLLPLKADHFTEDTEDEDSQRRKRDRQFLPAFASNQPNVDDLPKFPDLPDEAFRHLLPANYEEDPLLIRSESDRRRKDGQYKKDLISKCSEPIRIPSSRKQKSDLEQELINCKNSSPGCSSLGSFVIVDMKTPFAPNDQNDLGSFFNGPSPTFKENNLADEMEDITSHLAQMESISQEWNSFVESITSKEEDL